VPVGVEFSLDVGKVSRLDGSYHDGHGHQASAGERVLVAAWRCVRCTSSSRECARKPIDARASMRDASRVVRGSYDESQWRGTRAGPSLESVYRR
jgi:hypothetical protein